ncbi:MAG: zf-HC2 domain-containing protein [Pyrinomonadaceae bacterium]
MMLDEMRQMAVQCPTHEISAYIDGELDLVRELELESHFASCELCSEELNQQKQFLCSLNSSLKQEREIELPKDFTKHIVANAESNVSGLRGSRERYNAMFICAALFLFVLFAMGAEADKMFQSAYGFLGQSAAVLGFFGHLVYSLFVGVVIVVRSFASQFRLDVVVVMAVAGFFAAALMLVSRKVLSMRRA